MSIQLSNQIRGVMKTFGLIVPRSKGQVFEGHVRELLAGNDNLAKVNYLWSMHRATPASMLSTWTGSCWQRRATARQPNY